MTSAPSWISVDDINQVSSGSDLERSLIGAMDQSVADNLGYYSNDNTATIPVDAIDTYPGTAGAATHQAPFVPLAPFASVQQGGHPDAQTSLGHFEDLRHYPDIQDPLDKVHDDQNWQYGGIQGFGSGDQLYEHVDISSGSQSLTEPDLSHRFHQPLHLPHQSNVLPYSQEIQHMDQANMTTGPPLICAFCNKSFKVKGDLTRHSKTHTQPALYHCLVMTCPRANRREAFHRKDKLVDHLVAGHKMSKDEAKGWVNASP